jgi:RNA polymerase sigma-70 factor (ECF subfamily)
VAPPTRPYSERTEVELVALAKGGHTAAFGEIVRRLEPRVAATVIGLLGRGMDAEDVGQETFLRLYRSLSAFRGDSSLASYTTRIAINLCRDHRRRQKRRSSVFVAALDRHVENIVDSHEGASSLPDRELLQRGLERLPFEYREVIVLRLLDGLSTRETAEILKIPEGTATARLARGQMKLRDLLQSLQREEK